MNDRGDHRNCVGGCIPALSPAELARKGARYRLGAGQLEQLLTLLAGRCMVCLRCHAMGFDLTTRAARRRPRGLLCRFCKQRVAVAEGSYPSGTAFFTGCRCGSFRDPDGAARMRAATAQYLERTRSLDACTTNRERFDTLIRDITTRGPDPHRVWSGAPLSDLPHLPPRDNALALDEAITATAPLARARCTAECRDHDEHVYIACFEKPTTLRDADTELAVTHYVGWTRQIPPGRRVSQHGAACRKALIAVIPGNLSDEQELKDSGICPKCGRLLRYH